jgi:hypothetical protein
LKCEGDRVREVVWPLAKNVPAEQPVESNEAK